MQLSVRPVQVHTLTDLDESHHWGGHMYPRGRWMEYLQTPILDLQYPRRIHPSRVSGNQSGLLRKVNTRGARRRMLLDSGSTSHHLIRVSKWILMLML